MIESRIWQRLGLREEVLKKFCLNHKIKRLALYGSALRDDFKDTSDIDLLIEFDEDAEIGLFAFVGIEQELADLLGCRVDLASWEAIQESHNEIRKHSILDTAKVLYAA